MAVATIDAVATLVHEVEVGLPLGPNAIVVDSKGAIQVRRPPPPTRHTFELDGIRFHVAVTPRGLGAAVTTLYQIWAEVGVLPYSIQSREKRDRLLSILRETAGLPGVRFVVDERQTIVALGQRDVPGTLTLTDLMYETLQFLQGARPYLALIGRYL